MTDSATLLPGALREKAIAHLQKKDRRLAKIIDQIGDCQLRVQKQLPIDVYLIRAVVYQQLHGRAAAAIFGRLLEAAAVPPQKMSARLLKMKPEQLRACGLSGSKQAAIGNLAQAAVAGKIPDTRQLARMSEAQAIEALTQLRGIGPWTVQMLLIFRLGRPDVLATSDYGLRRGFMLVRSQKQMPTPKELLAYGECWRPYRSIASWYLWRATELLGKD
jgi:DNA-3-methyladenine glycosylase II